ncbi:exopolysaccharide biosynthesis protein [Aliihoeflea sp. PC F10.4]
MTDHIARCLILPMPDPCTASAKTRLSEIFRRLSDEAGERVSVEALLGAMGDRGFAMLLLLFATLNLLPLPPGTTVILGLPLVLVSAQLMLGLRKAWLPGFIVNRSISAERFRQSIGTILPRLERLERLVRPRWWPFDTDTSDRYLGVITFILSVVVFLPIPLGNWLPAFAVAILALALSERDGIFLGLGVALALLSLAIICAVGVAGAALASAVFGF